MFGKRNNNKNFQLEDLDLDQDLKLRARIYNYSIRRYKSMGKFMAMLTLLFIAYESWQLSCLNIGWGEKGSYIGGIAGPFMAYAGFVLIYATLMSQQKQYIYQSQAIRDQDRQFAIQSFDNSFFNLLNRYTQLTATNRSESKVRPTSLSYIKEELDRWEEYFQSYLEQGELPNVIPKDELLRWQASKFSGKARQLKMDFMPLLSILFFLHTTDVGDKEKYFGILDYQVSETEKYILFYLFITYGSLFSDQEKVFVPDFLRRIDADILVHPDHLRWLPPPSVSSIS